MNKMVSPLQDLSQVKLMYAASIDPKRNEIQCIKEQVIWEHVKERTVVPELRRTRRASEGRRCLSQVIKGEQEFSRFRAFWRQSQHGQRHRAWKMSGMFRERAPEIEDVLEE